MNQARHRKDFDPCNDACENKSIKPVEKDAKIDKNISVIDQIFGFGFWASLSLYIISIAKVSYLIPQLFSEAGVVRYSYKIRGNGEHFKALDYKNTIQFEILKEIPFLNTVVSGIYPFVIFLIIVFIFKLYRTFKNENHVKLSGFETLNRISNPILFDVCIKVLSFSLASLGILITTFSIWGSWQ